MKLICINKDTPVHEAQQIMKEKRIRHLPVTNHLDEIVGILTDRDLLSAGQFQSLPIEVFANPHVEFVPNEMPIRIVALKMLEKKISCVLLTDENKEVVGILTTDDLLFHLSELLKKDDHKEVSLLDQIKANPWAETVGELARKLSEMGI